MGTTSPNTTTGAGTTTRMGITQPQTTTRMGITLPIATEKMFSDLFTKKYNNNNNKKNYDRNFFEFLEYTLKNQYKITPPNLIPKNNSNAPISFSDRTFNERYSIPLTRNIFTKLDNNQRNILYDRLIKFN
jgi:hypothetical protein